MATVSEFDKIRSSLIQDGLGAFRCLVESTRLDLGVVVSSDTVQAVRSSLVTKLQPHSTCNRTQSPLHKVRKDCVLPCNTHPGRP